MSTKIVVLGQRGTVKSCTCSDCREACERKPGWFLPGEAKKAAKHLGLSLEAFFDKYLLVDYWEQDRTLPFTYVLSPAIVGVEPGSVFPSNPTGTCVFFKNGLCEIHAVKPYECRTSLHEETGQTGLSHRGVAQKWNTPKGKKEVDVCFRRERATKGRAERKAQ